MTDQVSIRTLKRLTAAEGYLELDLPDYALEELEGITDIGPFRGVVDWMKGEALKDKQEYVAAIEMLQRAVRDIPAPHNGPAMQTLTECFRSTGQDDLADLTEIIAASNETVESPAPEALPFSGSFDSFITPWGRMTAMPENEAE